MDLFRLPQRIERNLFFATTIFVWLLVLAPYVFAYLHTPVNHTCTFLIGYPDTEVCDQNFYIAWGPAQAANKHFLFEDKLNGYTNQRLVFNSWWLLTGKISGWLRVDTFLFNQIQRFIVIPVLCLVVFNFIGVFFSEKKYRFMAFWLILFSGYNLSPYPEGNIFESMLWEVILPVAHIFFFVTLYYCYQAAFQNGSVWKAGIASLIMSTVYPYTTVSVCFIIGCVFLFLVLNKQLSLRQAIFRYTIIFLFTIPMVLYDYWIVNSDKRYIDGIANFTSSPIWNFFPAYGLLFVFSLASIWFIRKSKDAALYFPILWMVCTLTQIYFPIQIIPFQIQLILGIQIPMSILAVYGFRELVSKRFQLVVKKEWLVFSAFLLSVSITNGYIYYRILKHVDKQIMPVYLENEIVEGMKWLKTNSHEEDVVIATPIISSYIPVFSNNRIYCSDYYAPTPDFYEKEKKINWLFSSDSLKTDTELSSFLKNNRISFIFQNNYHDRKNNALEGNLFGESSLIKKVYQNNYVHIYRINQPL